MQFDFQENTSSLLWQLANTALSQIPIHRQREPHSNTIHVPPDASHSRINRLIPIIAAIISLIPSDVIEVQRSSRISIGVGI